MSTIPFRELVFSNSIRACFVLLLSAILQVYIAMSLNEDFPRKKSVLAQLQLFGLFITS